MNFCILTQNDLLYLVLSVAYPTYSTPVGRGRGFVLAVFLIFCLCSVSAQFSNMLNDLALRDLKVDYLSLVDCLLKSL
jgi:hypothetical protein